jgi:triosephosphate isomerase
MRKTIIAGNWKMNMTTIEAGDLVEGILEKTDGVDNVEIVVAPPFTALEAVRETIGSAPIGLSAQNVHWEESGAHTGEISCEMLSDIGCEWVIIGHSERRQYFGETDETVNKRTKAALSAGLKTIVCVGETLEEREAEKTFAVIESQLTGGLAGIGENDFQKIVIAYEPVWAIGTGKTATKEQAQEIHAFIRNWLKDNVSAGVAESTRILYGGSVKPGNAGELLGEPDIDGALVGGASLKADDFSAIIRAS